MRALIFDDDPSTGRILVRTGAKLGWDAVAISDAAAFAQSLQTARPDLILLDLNLGDTDGPEQLHLLAARHYAGALVLMSGSEPLVHAAARADAARLGLGITDGLKKPMHLWEIQAMFTRAAAAFSQTARPLAYTL